MPDPLWPEGYKKDLLEDTSSGDAHAHAHALSHALACMHTHARMHACIHARSCEDMCAQPRVEQERSVRPTKP